MFQNETPNSFYNANFKIDIAIASYLVGVCLSYRLLLEADLGEKVLRTRQIPMRVGNSASNLTFRFCTQTASRDINHIDGHSEYSVFFITHKRRGHRPVLNLIKTFIIVNGENLLSEN